jgi:hypothetical protein
MLGYAIDALARVCVGDRSMQLAQGTAEACSAANVRTGRAREARRARRARTRARTRACRS